MFQVGLHSEVDVSPLVDSDSLNVLELTAEGRDSPQLFTRVINIELPVLAVGDIKRTLCIENSLGRKRVPAIDESM